MNLVLALSLKSKKEDIIKPPKQLTPPNPTFVSSPQSLFTLHFFVIVPILASTQNTVMISPSYTRTGFIVCIFQLISEQAQVPDIYIVLHNINQIKRPLTQGVIQKSHVRIAE